MTAAPVRPEIEGLKDSEIVDVWQMGWTVPDVIGLWVGEGDTPTPAFICDAAAAALRSGETFYTHKRGIPELRQAIGEYLGRLHGRPIPDSRIAVTTAGMNAMMLIVETLVGPGDNIVIVTPVWPNLAATVQIMGGEVRSFPMQSTPGRGSSGWTLDLDGLFAACDARTRAIYLASPGNPTGWVMSSAEQKAVLDFARERGLWVIADEVYQRLVYDLPAGKLAAPSFLDFAGDDDPVVVVNSFSKTWAMTGWRLGWMAMPTSLTPIVDKLIEFNTSGGQAFLQRAGITAIREGESFVAEMVERCRQGRDLVVQRLGALPRVRLTRPEGAFYVMFEVDGMTDALGFAKRLVSEARVGLAPGTAFGPGGEGKLRLCFAASRDRLSAAMDRLEPALS